MRQRLAVAAGAALLVAGLILVMFVLPAEYAVDPLGTGARLGLLDSATPASRSKRSKHGDGERRRRRPIIVAAGRGLQAGDGGRSQLGRGEGMEYKYRLDKGEALLYSWKAPARSTTSSTPSPTARRAATRRPTRRRTRQTGASGTLTAPFSGIHGWYWENTTDQEVTVTLTTAGYYNLSHEFRRAAVKNKNFK